MKDELVSTKRYWTLPKSCGSQSSEWEERKKSRAKRGWLCEPCRPRKTVTCHALGVVEPVRHQAPLRGMEELEALCLAGVRMAAPPGGRSPGLPLDLVAAGRLLGSSQDTRHKLAHFLLSSRSVTPCGLCRFDFFFALEQLRRVLLFAFPRTFSPLLPQRTSVMLIVGSCFFSVTRGVFRVPLRGFPCLLYCD